MKTVITILILLFAFNVNAQFKKSETGIFAKYINGKVYDKNGNSIEGIIKRRDGGGIKFKTNGDTIKYYDHRHISGFDLFEKYKTSKYEYKKLKDGFFHLVEVEKKGKMNLYSISGYQKSAYNSLNHSTSYTSSRGMPYTNYYIEKNGITIKVNKKIIKQIDDLFGDCPLLIEKIKNGKYGDIKKIWKDGRIREVVNVYNRCHERRILL